MGGAAYDWFWTKMNAATRSRQMTQKEIEAYRASKLEQQRSEKNIFDSLWYKISATVGLCTPTAAQLSDYLQKAEEHTRRAKNLADFGALDPRLQKSLQSSADAIGAVHGYVEKAVTVAGDVTAACEIGQAVSVLNKWAASPNGDNRAAAEAFDKLFGGVARYAEKLPGPVSAYAKVLDQISVSQFFTNMQALGDSRVGNNTRTPTGRQMKEVLDELDRQSRGGR
jgi:hypothetical protein